MPETPQPLVVRARVGVIGDIHTEAEVLSWALGVLRAHDVEHILATGDIPDGELHAEGINRVCQQLAAAGVHAVSGNHERWLLDGEMRDLPDATDLREVDAHAQAFLRGLPAVLELATPLGLMLLGHGVGSDDMATLYPHDHAAELTNNAALQALLRQGRYRLCVHGHTHRRMVRVIEQVTFINAGTLRRTREPGCLLLDFEARQARFFDYAPDGTTANGPVFPL